MPTNEQALLLALKQAIERKLSGRRTPPRGGGPVINITINAGAQEKAGRVGKREMPLSDRTVEGRIVEERGRRAEQQARDDIFGGNLGTTAGFLQGFLPAQFYSPVNQLKFRGIGLYGETGTRALGIAETLGRHRGAIGALGRGAARIGEMAAAGTAFMELVMPAVSGMVSQSLREGGMGMLADIVDRKGQELAATSASVSSAVSTAIPALQEAMTRTKARILIGQSLEEIEAAEIGDEADGMFFRSRKFLQLKEELSRRVDRDVSQDMGRKLASMAFNALG